MTRDDAVLDPEILLKNSPITLHRIARDKYADLSGIGAARSPGRWNNAGQEAIYTSLNSSTAQLEVLGHTPKEFVPKNLVRMQIRFTGNWNTVHSPHPLWAGISEDQILVDPATKAYFLIFRSLATAREALPLRLTGSGIVGAAVPSVHDEHWNVVLFPQAANFGKHVSLSAVESFAFDDRLFPASAIKGR